MASNLIGSRRSRASHNAKQNPERGIELWDRLKAYRPGQRVRWKGRVWVALPAGDTPNVGIVPEDSSLFWDIVRFGGRDTMKDTASTYAFEVELPLAGTVYVCRRPNLFNWLKTRQWPEPITQMVRKILVSGGNAQAGETETVETFIETATMLLRECAMVVPEDVVSGERTVEQITADDWRPLFVREDQRPGPDQMILLPPDAQYDAEMGEEYCYIHQGDLSHFVTMMTFNTPGAMSRFRSVNARRHDSQADAVEAVVAEEEYEPADEPVDRAGPS